MFCFQCGNPISDDSVFCSKCGTRIQQSVVTAQETSNNGELDREALKIYLANVLSLECIKSNIESNIHDVSDSIEYTKNNNYYKKYEFDNGYHCLQFFYNGKMSFIAYTNSWGGSVSCKRGFDCWLPIDENYSYLSSKSAYQSIVSGLYNIFENSSRKAKARDKFIESYKEFSSEASEKYKTNLDYINEKNALLNNLNKELDDVINLLENAYSINIIPSTFRNNLHAIYYLHDFVVSSSQSFTTALLHCDLDDIKIRLDSIIEQQKEIIINQALMMAQNDKIIKQNNQKLQHLASIEKNTANALQYSQIAANNTEACAWIGVANYISKKL